MSTRRTPGSMPCHVHGMASEAQPSSKADHQWQQDASPAVPAPSRRRTPPCNPRPPPPLPPGRGDGRGDEVASELHGEPRHPQQRQPPPPKDVRRVACETTTLVGSLVDPPQRGAQLSAGRCTAAGHLGAACALFSKRRGYTRAAGPGRAARGSARAGPCRPTRPAATARAPRPRCGRRSARCPTRQKRASLEVSRGAVSASLARGERYPKRRRSFLRRSRIERCGAL